MIDVYVIASILKWPYNSLTIALQVLIDRMTSYYLGGEEWSLTTMNISLLSQYLNNFCTSTTQNFILANVYMAMPTSSCQIVV